MAPLCSVGEISLIRGKKMSTSLRRRIRDWSCVDIDFDKENKM